MKAAIIGGGLAALMAAYTLSEQSETDISLFYTGSGASPFVHGFNIPLDPGDSPRIFAADIEKSGCGLSNPRLVKKLCEESLELLPFLERIGVQLDRKEDGYALLKPLGSSFPRVVSSGNHTGARLLNVLRNKLRAKGNVRFLDGVRVLRLLCRCGQVCGVTAFDQKNGMLFDLPADVAVLATGGFCGIFPFSTNSSDIGGDGIAMAYLAGAALTDMEFIQFEPSAAVYPPELVGQSVITTMFYEGAVLRNNKGERFMRRYSEKAEQVNKDVLSLCIAQEISNGAGTAHGGVYFDATGVGADVLHRKYSSYVERYSRRGIDIAKEMFEIAPAAHTSLGGVIIDENCATAVKGLFAAGEITGGLHGANRIGGNAGLETLIFGRQAGRSAARYLHDHTPGAGPLSPNDLPRAVRLSEDRMRRIRGEMEQILETDLSVIRERDQIKMAVERLADFLREVTEARAKDENTSSPRKVYEALRLENDLMCAWLFSMAARERTCSVGCHCLRDGVEDSGLYNVRLFRGESGPVVCRQYYSGNTEKE